jgi:hypothetical protein
LLALCSNPQPGGVPILVAFYDMHGLQWDYSFPRSPHGERPWRTCGFNIKMDIMKGTGCEDTDWINPARVRQIPLARFCEHGNEPSGSTHGGVFFD